MTCDLDVDWLQIIELVRLFDCLGGFVIILPLIRVYNLNLDLGLIMVDVLAISPDSD